MVKIHGVEVPLSDLPMLCHCLRWDCPDTYQGKKGVLKRLEEARKKQEILEGIRWKVLFIGRAIDGRR